MSLGATVPIGVPGTRSSRATAPVYVVGEDPASARRPSSGPGALRSARPALPICRVAGRTLLLQDSRAT